MATKINLIKLLQESRGLAELTDRNPRPRHPGPLCVPLQPVSSRIKRPKKVIHIVMQDPPDIPHPITIKVLK